MLSSSRPPVWAAALLVVLALAVVYARPLSTGFLNDDFLFLEQARRTPLAGSLVGQDALGNYYRPLSRALYFEGLAPWGGGSPAVFHAVNFTVWLVALGLLFDLLRRFAPWPAALAGTVAFALMPFQRVNLTWISCSQDLLALAGVLGSLALWRRGHSRLAALPAIAAFASKESALPLAAALIAWDRVIEHRPWKETWRRAAPVLATTAAWICILVAFHDANPGIGRFVRWNPAGFLAGFLHLIQSLLGIDHPPGFLAALLSHGPHPVALALLAAVALWIGRTSGSPSSAPASVGGNPPRAGVTFALLWLVAFGLPLGPVAHSWSSYYATLAAVGAALLAALALRRIGRGGWIVLSAALLWWHAGASATRAFSVTDHVWSWTSHLTPWYFERAATLTDSLSRQLMHLEPRPEPGTRFFFATLPPYAGFQMGNGALIRALYRDPTLESHFYSQFSESTVAGHPWRVLHWDGRELRPLYDGADDPLFQIGTDLLLLDRPEGAAFAFRRGLAAGGSPQDHLYALGWAELWRGDRDAAESAWTRWGARDDSTRWYETLRQAQTVWLRDRDSLAVQRLMLEAITLGIGRPEGHATLGRLLLPRRPKYGVLELKIAAWLDPRDAATRLVLAEGLASASLDDAARRELAALERLRPAGSDSVLARLRARLGAAGAGGVITF